MDEKQLRDEVVTLMLAGHETSANALAWTLHLLSIHPDIEQRLYEEIGRAVGDNPATAADLSRIPYLKQVVQESMRILPACFGPLRAAPNSQPNTMDFLSPKNRISGSCLMRFIAIRVYGPSRRVSIPNGFSP